MNGPQTLDDVDRLDWPARFYGYGTWGYALSQARERAERYQQRMWLFRATLDSEPVWVVSWDPKRRPERDASALSVGSASVRDTNLGSTNDRV